jgi:anti-sigma factor RsiW
MSDGRTIGDLDLLAYVDGHLDPARRRQVEAHLAEHPDEAAWVRDCLRQDELIRALYEDAYRETPPEALVAALEGRDRRAARPAMRMAAALLALAATGVTGWWIGKSSLAPSDAYESFLAEAVAAHRSALYPETAGVELATFGDVQALSWLAEKTTFELQAPDLGELGLELVERRVVAAQDGRAGAQLTYEDGDGRKVTVYLRPRWSEREPAFRLGEHDGWPTAWWVSGPLTHALTGDLPEDELLALAEAFHARLGRPGTEMVPRIPEVEERPLRALEAPMQATVDDGPLAPLDVPQGERPESDAQSM